MNIHTKYKMKEGQFSCPSAHVKLGVKLTWNACATLLAEPHFSLFYVERDIHAEKPDEKWVGDITYLKTSLGWVYLAAVIDLYNREVIGYSVSRSIDSELTCRALGNALVKRKRKEDGLVFHRDYAEFRITAIADVSTAAGDIRRCCRRTGSGAA